MRCRLPLLSFLLVAFLSLAAATANASGGQLLKKSFTHLPFGDDLGHRAVAQPDGKIVVAGSARFGTMRMALTRYNADGTLDTTFGNGGTAIDPFDEDNGEAWGVALQPDGKIVVVGQTRRQFDRMRIMRFNADGSVDFTFANVVQGIGNGAGAFAVRVQPDGKIVVGGYSIGGSGRKVFTLVRLTASGAPDATFAGGGFATGVEGSGDEVIRALGLQSDGRIVAAGDGATYIAVQRFTTGGSFDPSWVNRLNPNVRGGYDLVVDPDDKVAIVGTMPDGAISDFAVMRMTADGHFDSTFGPGNACPSGSCPGIAAMSVGDGAVGIGLARQPDGKYVVSGSTSLAAGGSAVAIGRFTADGSADATFGTAGRQTFSVSNPSGYGLARRAGGGFVVAGLANAPTILGGTDMGNNYDTLVVAFTGAGVLDATFNGSGYAQHDAGVIASSAESVTGQGDGKIIVAGVAIAEAHVPGVPAREGGVLVRYLPDLSLDTTFGTGGFVTLDWPIRKMQQQGDGKLVLAGYSLTNQGGSPVRSMTFARFLGSGAPDAGFGTAGVTVLAPTSAGEAANDVSIALDGKIIGAGAAVVGDRLDSLIARLTAAGIPDTTFNGSGKAIVSISAGDDQVNGVLALFDGKILAAGRADVGDASAPRHSMAVIQLNADGTRDTAFGTNGVAIVSFGSGSSSANALGFITGSRILLVGEASNGSDDDFALARLNADGTLDSTFGSGGQTVSGFNGDDRIYTLMYMSDDRFYVGGESAGRFAVAHYRRSGVLEANFGSGGIATYAMNGVKAYVGDMMQGMQIPFTLAGNASGVIGLAQIQSNTESSGIGYPGVVVSSSLNPSFTDQSVTLTITVSGNVGTPTGTVNVQDNYTAIPGCSNLPLTNGRATCTTTFTTGGRHDIFVNYPGDANYYSGSGSSYQDVIQRLNTASVSLAASPNPAGFGENVDIVASVTGGAGTPTGTVRFRDGTGDIYGCTAVPLSGGSATCRTDGLASGTRALAAVYSGDASYNEATSATINESVGPAPAPTRAWRTLTTGTTPLALENPNFRIPGRPRTAMDAAGDLYVAANTWTSSTSCMAILKYSGSTGGVLWRRDSCGAAQGTFASSLALDGSGNVMVTGAMASDLYVARLSGATGAPMWEQRFAHAPNSSSAGMSIGVDAAGNARLAALDSAGLTLYGIRGSDGLLQWQRTLDTESSLNRFSSFAVGPAGDVAVSYLDNTGRNDDTRQVFSRIDNNGVLAWTITNAGIPEVVVAANGDVITNGFNSVQRRSAATGTVLWTQQVPAGPLVLDAQGNILTTGTIGAGSGNSDAVTSKIAPDGQLLWSQPLVDGSSSVSMVDIAVDAAGNPVAAGTRFGSRSNSVTIKYSGADGHIVWIATEQDATYGMNAAEVQAGSSGAIVVGSLFGSGGSLGGIYAVKYGDAGTEPPPGPPRLGNISTRGQVLTGNDVMIGGFVIGGSGNKTVIVRARGPSLAAFGISNPLANPMLQLFRSSDQAMIAANDDWGSAANASDVAASGFAPSDSAESAILVNLPPGAYTAVVTGVGGTTGVAIVEVFEVDHPEVPLANISTRGLVGTGNDVMIGGFVVQGSGPQTVIVRARGPSLAPFGIGNALANPMLQLMRSSDQSTVASNDDWGSAPNAAAIAASGYAPPEPQESAILITLPPGAYTAIVTGAGSTTGVGIVEVFRQ